MQLQLLPLQLTVVPVVLPFLHLSLCLGCLRDTAALSQFFFTSFSSWTSLSSSSSTFFSNCWSVSLLSSLSRYSPNSICSSDCQILRQWVECPAAPKDCQYSPYTGGGPDRLYQKGCPKCPYWPSGCYWEFSQSSASPAGWSGWNCTWTSHHRQRGPCTGTIL